MNARPFATALAIPAVCCLSMATGLAAPAVAKVLNPQPLITTEINGADAEFLSTAAQTQQLQMLVARLASTKATENQLQLLGKALYEDGVSEKDSLAQLAADRQFPITVIQSSEAHTLSKNLARLNGMKLDKKLLETIVSLEQQRSAAYQAASTSTDPKIRDFALTRYAAVQENLLLASKLAGVPMPKPLAPIAEPPPR